MLGMNIQRQIGRVAIIIENIENKSIFLNQSEDR